MITFSFLLYFVFKIFLIFFNFAESLISSGKLQSFFSETVNLFGNGNVNFNMREKEDVICKELKKMIRLIWKWFKFKEIFEPLASQIALIIENVELMYKKFDGKGTKGAVEEMIRLLIFQKFLYFVYNET